MATDHNFKVKNGLTVQGETLVVNHTGDLSGTQVYIKYKDSNTNLMRWGEGTSGQSTYRFRIDQDFKFIGNSGSGDNIILNSNTGNIRGTTFNVGSTEIIDSSRSLTNIGTISSGAITSSGNITTSGVLQVNVGTASHQRFRITRPSSTTAALYMGVDSSNNAMIAANNSALRIGKDVAGTFYEYLTVESGGNTNVKNALEINNTTVIDSSRNLTNIGTISSGAITSTGNSVFTGSGSSGDAFIVQRGSDSAESLRVLNTGEVLVSSNYFYVNAAAGAYFDGNLRARGGISNDNGDLQLNDNVRITGNLDVDGIIDNTRNNGNVAAPNTADHTAGTRISFYDTTATSWYAMGIESNTLWFNSDTAYKWYEDGALRMHLNGANLSVTGTVTASGGNSTNWNTAYGWGDHSTAGYLTSNQTITLSGDVSGSGTTSISVSVNDDSHFHHRLDSTDDRDVKPSDTGIVTSVQAIKPFFTSFGGMTGTANTTYLDMLAFDTYSDSSGGGPSAITFHKSASVGSPQMYIWKGAWNGTTWGTGQRVFADNYHPNADKLTTARNINGVAFDGTANITVADSTKLPLAGGTMTGAINMNSNNLSGINNGTAVSFLSTNGYWVGGTQRINGSGDLVNIGTISSGSVTIDPSGTYGTGLTINAGDTNTAGGAAKQLVLSFGGSSSIDYAHSIRTRHDSGAAATNTIEFWLWNYGTDSSSTVGTLRSTVINSSGLDIKSGGLMIGTTTVIDSSRNVITPTIRIGQTDRWKIRGNNGNANLAFEYSTSSGLSDSNIKFELTSTQANLNGDLYFTKSPDPRIYAGSNVGLNIDGQALYLNRNTNSNILVGSGSAPATLSGLNVHMNGSSYVLASDGTRSAFMGADSSGYAIFGSLTNHDAVIRTNNTERVRVATNGNVTFKGETFTFHGSGSATYTSTALYINQTYGVLLEGSLQSNSSGAVKNPLVFTWRGNWNTQGGIKVEAGKTTVDSLAIKSGNSSTTVIDASRNLFNVNLKKFRDHTASFYISPTNTNTLNAQHDNADDTSDIWINYRGYNDTFSNFRDFRIGDGKGTELFFVDGSDRTFRFGGSAVTSPKVAIGNVTPTKNLHVYTSANEGIFLQGTGGGVWMDVQSNSSQLWSMGADGNGWAIYNRNNNTYRLRCENGNDVDIVSGGLKVGGTTVIDSSRNITASTAVIYGGADNKLQLRETTSGTVPWNYIEYRNSANTRNAYIGTNTSGDFQIYGETGMSLLYTNMNFTAGGVTNSVSGYQVNGTTVIDSSRQLFDVSVSEPEAEYGQSLNGNFGQWLAHSRYAASPGFNSDVDYWGWNYVQGNINAPHTGSSQWYRNRVALGNAYGHGISSGDYWLEMAYPRYGLTNAGHMYIRACESGSIGSWYEVGSNIRGNQSVGGNIVATGNVTAYSDVRLKDNIQTLDGSKVLEMRGVSFTKNEEAGSGVIAQELEKIAPELVHDNEDGYKSVAYGNLTGYLIEAIKEQDEKIKKLEELVEKLISEK